MKKPNRLLAVSMMVACLALPARAVIITEFFTFNPAAPIPENGPLGLSQIEAIASTILVVDSITVDLNISRAVGNPGGFNGDLFVSLSSLNGGFSVLMNRVGRTQLPSPVPFLTGYNGGGVNVTFDDAAANGDIHVYEDAVGPVAPTDQLTGTWAPDGRNSDPTLVSTGDSRSALLASFAGFDPSTDWTLVVQDFSAGTEMILDSWTVTITGDNAPGGPGGPGGGPGGGVGGVPEPGTLATMLLVMGALPMVRRARRKKTAES